MRNYRTCPAVSKPSGDASGASEIESRALVECEALTLAKLESSDTLIERSDCDDDSSFITINCLGRVQSAPLPLRSPPEVALPLPEDVPAIGHDEASAEMESAFVEGSRSLCSDPTQVTFLALTSSSCKVSRRYLLHR